MDFPKFVNLIWKKLQSSSQRKPAAEIDPALVWTEINSYIKVCVCVCVSVCARVHVCVRDALM